MNVETLPVLTVCQPYADLIAHGVKLIENRVWRTAYLYTAVLSTSSRYYALLDARSAKRQDAIELATGRRS